MEMKGFARCSILYGNISVVVRMCEYQYLLRQSILTSVPGRQRRVSIKKKEVADINQPR